MPSCEFEPTPSYIVDRLPSLRWAPVPGHPDLCNLHLTMDDLPIVARTFGLEFEVREGRIHWICRICGDLGSRLVCDPEKHRVHYKEREKENGTDALEPLDELGERDRAWMKRQIGR